MHFKVSFKSPLVIYFFFATTLTMIPTNQQSGINVSTVNNDDNDSLIDDLGLLSFTDNATLSTATTSRSFLANVGSLFRPSKSPPSMAPVYRKAAPTPDIPSLCQPSIAPCTDFRSPTTTICHRSCFCSCSLLSCLLKVTGGTYAGQTSTIEL